MNMCSLFVVLAECWNRIGNFCIKPLFVSPTLYLLALNLIITITKMS